MNHCCELCCLMSRFVCLFHLVLFTSVVWIGETFPLSKGHLQIRSTPPDVSRETRLYMAKRKTRVKRVAEKRNQNANVEDFSSNAAITSPSSSSSSSSPSSSSFDVNAPSQLAPLKSTAAEKQQNYEEKPAIQRKFEELFAPTPAGQDPKLAVLAKQVTWAAVIVLVLIEIFVSIKTGGMPFSKEAVRI